MKNNKGMSLIELIIVIAIMAVMMGILAPQFMKYVEGSRVSKDEYEAEQIKKVIAMSWTIEVINQELSMAPGEEIVVSYTHGADSFSCAAEYPHLEKEMESTISIPFYFESKKHSGQTYSVILGCDADGTYYVEGDPEDDACWSGGN